MPPEHAPAPPTTEPATRPQPRGQELVAWGLLAVAAVVLFIVLWPGFDGKGSPSYARKWSGRLASVQSPEEAKAKFSDIVTRRYDNGEWLVGVCSDSHCSPWGGTIVIRDSRSRTRVFFGHVCGSNFLARMAGTQYSAAANLDEFYANLLKGDIRREWVDGR